MKGTQTATAEKEKQGIMSRVSEDGRREIIKSALALLFGAIYAGANIGGNLSPFGVSLVAALKGKYSFFALFLILKIIICTFLAPFYHRIISFSS